MTGKQCIQAVIERRPADRVPLGLYAVDCDIVSRVLGRPTYVRNKVEMQIALWEGRRAEVAESLKKDTVEFYRKISCADLLLPKEAQLLPPRDYQPEFPTKIGEDRWQLKNGRIYQASRAVNEVQCVYIPPAQERRYTIEDFKEVATPDPSIFEVFDYVYDQLGEERYIAGSTGGVTGITLLGGTENGLLMYALEPEVVLAASWSNVAQQNALDACYIRNGVPGVLMEQDMAGTNGPLLSPQMFRDMCLPVLKERIAHVRQFAPQVIFHSCGNNIPIMDQMIEAGVNCYQSLQTTAGMEIGKLKALFGDRLCFWGGVALETLISGSPEDVRKEVRTAMEAGAPGGGFILGPSHSIAYGTKYENFMAMVDEYDRLKDRF